MAHAALVRHLIEPRALDSPRVEAVDWRRGSADTRPVSYEAWFQCINGCKQRFSLFEVIYRCPQCGDLLDVVHDLEALKDRSAAAWISLFEERMRRNTWP
jgi:hypothetical protein